jgi:hypothetical protein
VADSHHDRIVDRNIGLVAMGRTTALLATVVYILLKRTTVYDEHGRAISKADGVRRGIDFASRALTF